MEGVNVPANYPALVWEAFIHGRCTGRHAALQAVRNCAASARDHLLFRSFIPG